MPEPTLPGRIVTFYSYKGGTGRSMALANFGWLLAANGMKVLMVDWDLEAPGLHRYLRPFLADADLFETDGLIDAFWSLTAAAVASGAPAPAAEPGARTPAAQSTVTAAALRDVLEDSIRRVNWKFPSGGFIDFLPAGRQDDTYSDRVNTFDWKKFYELGGAQLLTAAKADLRSRYEWMLIDSRTGVSDTSGICTMQLPDVVVPCFTMNRQSIEGVAAILRSIRAYRSPTVDGSKIAFFPVATRIESGEKDRLEAARAFARSEMQSFVPADAVRNPREYWDQMEIAYRPSYAFEEVLAAFGDATGAAGAADTMLAQMERMTQRIAANAEIKMPEVLDSDRADVLRKYALGTQTARPGDKNPASSTSSDQAFLRGVFAKEQLWRTSGYRWRNLLSRRELDLLVEEDRKSFGRNMSYYHAQSVRMHTLFRATERGGPTLSFAAFVAVALFVVFGLGWWRTRVPANIELAGALYAFVVVWLALAVVWSVVVGRDVPQGVTWGDIVVLSIYGPFRPPIREYEQLLTSTTKPR